MPWWVFLLIAVFGYLTGFLLSGWLFSYNFGPDTNRSDLVSSMILWPLVTPCYVVYRSVLSYIVFLERTRDRKRPPKTTLLYGRWETHE